MKNHLFQILKQSFKLSKTSNNYGGFTLLELLIAAGLTSISIALAGSAVFFVTQNNKIGKSETERRVELNRSLDFISDEIRQANPIAMDALADLSATPAVAPNFDRRDKTPVLSLKIPGVSQRVIYYLAAPPTGSLWFGDSLVYRWGPKLNDRGEYQDKTNPAVWEHKPLVDSIVNNSPTTTPTCPSGWSLNPPSPTGFYACVDPKGQIANLTFRGKLTDAYGKVLDPYEASSQAFARPGNTSFSINTGSSSSGGNGGTVTITQRSNAYFEVLGGGLQCFGAPGDPTIPTTTTINVVRPGGVTDSQPIPSDTQALSFPPLEPGATVTVTGTSTAIANCSGRTFNSQTNNGTQVLTLRNGDTVPLFTPLGSQPTIDTFLTRYLDPATGKVKLANNQVIYLFELGTTSSTSRAYDMQDLVVLATISPEEEP